MGINVERFKITVSKDCDLCTHRGVCIYRDAMKKFSNEKLIYSMVQYLESNNVMRTFEQHANCKHFQLNFPLGAIKYATHEQLISDTWNKVAKLQFPDLKILSCGKQNDEDVAGVSVENPSGEKYRISVDDIYKDYVVVQ